MENNSAFISKIKENKAAIAIFAAAAIALYSFLGYAGVRSVFGIMLLWLAPSYLIVSPLNLNAEEKIFFSFFTGIVIVPSLVYWMSFLMPFRISMLLAAALLLIIGVFLRKTGRKPINSNA